MVKEKIQQKSYRSLKANICEKIHYVMSQSEGCGNAVTNIRTHLWSSVYLIFNNGQITGDIASVTTSKDGVLHVLNKYLKS